jgi:chemotaxis signal transduction protein
MTEGPDPGIKIEARTVVETQTVQFTEEAQVRVEAIWRERANRLSRRAASIESGREALGVIVLGIGMERYGVRLGDVAEVLAPVRPTPVPGGARVIAGVINVHGEIRPVLDLRRVLGMDAIHDGSPSRTILLRKGAREAGVQIDSVEHIRRISPADMKPGPGAGARGSRHIEASTKDLLMLLSTDALFAELDFGLNTEKLQEGESN